MNPNEPVAKTGTSRYRWLWIFLVALLATGPVMLILYFSLRLSENELRTAQSRVQALAPTDRPSVVPQTRPSDAVPIAPVAIPAIPAIPATPAAPVVSKVLPHIVRIRVRFDDFAAIREAYALVVEYSNSTSHLIAPAETFAPVAGKVNGRVVIRGAHENVEFDFWKPSIAEGFGPPAMGTGMAPGGFGMGGGVPSAGPMGSPAMAVPGMTGMSYSSSGGMGSSGSGFGSALFTFAILKELPETGLVALATNTGMVNPVRVLGDSPKASVGDKLTVVSLRLSSDTAIELPGMESKESSEVTVLGVDESVQLESGQRLDHLIKLTAWTGEPGVVVCNAKGDPVGQIAHTTSATEGTRLSYAVPMDRIFQAFYSQNATSNSNAGMSMGPGGSERASPVATGELPGASGASPIPTAASGFDPAESRPADAINPDQSAPTEIRAYRVLGNASESAETIRTLFGEVAKVALDRASQSVIVMASADVHQKVEAIIRRAEETGEELKRAAAVEKKRNDLEEAERTQTQLAAALEEAAKKEAADWEAHRKEPRRTRLVKVPGRKPEEISRLLTDLFGEKANVAVDEPTGAVLITINRAETWGEVQFLLAEIEATAARLASSDATGGMPLERLITPRANAANGSGFGTGFVPVKPVTDDSEGALDQESRKLAIRLRTATPTDAPALRGELERLTEKHFQQRQARRKQEIDELSSRIDQLRMTHQRRQQNKHEVIQRRIRELLDPNNDLNWKESRTGLKGSATSFASGAGPSIGEEVLQATVADAPVGNSSDAGSTTAGNAEKTFDGVPYSQWLTMLTTEQKRAKLVVAVEACSRLAKSEDVREIIRGIFVAAAVIEVEGIEHEDANLLNSALNRLPAADVVDELLVALNAPKESKSDHAFFGYYLAFECSESIIEVLQSRDQEVIRTLIKPALQIGDDRNALLAAACRIWRLSDRPASDFEGLLPLVIQCLDSGRTVEGQRLRPEWRLIVESLIIKNPETPELAMKLMKRATQNIQVLELVGKLGRNAESAVPVIVDEFVREWNSRENLATTPAGRMKQLRRLDPDYPPRLVQFITALGEIGSGEKGAVLLRDLNLIAPEINGPDAVSKATFAAAASAKAKYMALPESHKVSLLLSDSTMLMGRWNWTTLTPGTAPPNYVIRFNYDRTVDRLATNVERQDALDHVQLPEAFAVPIWGFSHPQQFLIDSTTSPKRISLVYPGFGKERPEIRREGIYELTETTLRIQLSANDSSPTAFATDTTVIPDGQVLLELTRVTPNSNVDPAGPR